MTNFEVPIITIQLLNHVFKVLEKMGIVIPYIGILSRKSYLQAVFFRIDPTDRCNFFQATNQDDNFNSQTDIPIARMDPKVVSSEMVNNLPNYDSNISELKMNQEKMMSPKTNDLSIPDLDNRYDHDDILQENVESNSDRQTSSSPQYDAPLESVHNSDTDQVKGFSPECKCEHCINLEKVHVPIDDNEFLLPPACNIVERARINNKKDKYFEKYLNEKQVPSVNDPLLTKHIPKRIIVNAEKRILKAIDRRENVKAMKLDFLKNTNQEKTSQPLEIVYTNLNAPIQQLPVLLRNKWFAKDIVCISELQIDPKILTEKTLFHNDWDVFHHPVCTVTVGKSKKNRIFSCILVNRRANLLVKQQNVKAPATSIHCSLAHQDEIFDFNVTVIYRTHINQFHNNNIALGIYNKNTSKTDIRIQHNNFYLNLFKYITTKLQLKIPGLICGDFNCNWEDPRSNDNNEFCKNLRVLFTRYDNKVKGDTNFTYKRSKNSKKGTDLSSSKIDSFLVKNMKGVLKSYSGNLCLNDGHAILSFRSERKSLLENCFITRTVIKPAPKNVIFKTALAAYHRNLDELLRLHQEVITLTNQGFRFAGTNPFTRKLVSILEEVVALTSTVKEVKIKISNQSCNPSPYSTELSDSIFRLERKYQKRGLTEKELKLYVYQSKILRLSVKKDVKEGVGTVSSKSELDNNDIYAINRHYNPKSKIAVGRTGNFTPDELLDHYLHLQDDRNNLPVDPNVKIWEGNFPKLTLKDFNFEWRGYTKMDSLRKCFQSCKPFSKGIDSLVTMNILRSFPAEYCHLFAKCHEANIRSGQVPDYVLNTRLTQIPKLSADDLALLVARRFLSVMHVLGSGHGKNVSAVMTNHLDVHKLYRDSQNAFRKERSCSTALAAVFLKIAKWPKKQPKICLFLDSSNAFGVANPPLLRKIISKIADGQVKEYLCSLLDQRSVVVIDKGQMSRRVTMKKDAPGVPQGMPESPTLFSLLISDLDLSFTDLNEYLVVYADDISVLCTGPSMKDAITAAKESVIKVENYLTKVGIRTNVSKSSYMVFGKDKTTKLELNINGEVLTRKRVFRLLGLRFDDDLNIDPQIRYLVNTRFQKHRGLVNAVLYTKNRINIIGLFQSLYYGQMQFSIECWPRLSKSQGNKICAELIKPLLDIYGLPQFLPNQQKHSYMELLTRAGVQSPINVQDRSILCFANSILKAQNPQQLLFETLLDRLCIKFQDYEFQLRAFSNYHRAVLLSTGVAKLIFKKVSYKQFPGNMKDIIPEIPIDLKAHFDTHHFKRVCKTYFKYKCPHTQGKHLHECKACVEMENAITQSTIHCQQCWIKKRGFSINYVYSEIHSNYTAKAPYAVSNILIKEAINSIPLFDAFIPDIAQLY